MQERAARMPSDPEKPPLHAVNTQGGDYAEGSIDKRQGTFVAGDLVIAEEQSYNVAGLPNPYMGLAAFTYADRAKYAGRQQQIAAALSKLTDPPRVLLFVTGASGSGKSSFVRAGVIPRLQGYYQPGCQVRIVEDMRPSQHPFDRLLDALQRQIGLPTQTINRSALPDSFYTFLARQTPPDHVNLLVIDQFEEVFTQAESAQRDALFSLLVHVPPFHAIRTHILITVRSDYLPEVFQIPTLYDHVKAGLELRAMSETELREAIQRPLQSLMQSIPDPLVRQKRFEPALLERLASDAAPDATYLPLLQVTLEDLWQRGALKLAAYKSLSDAIRERAEQCYAQDANEQPRPPAAQQMILQIFIALVDVSLDDDARRDVRHRQTLAELAGGEPARQRLIDELVHARLLSKGLEQRDGREIEVVDIIHESLIHNWQRLQAEIATQRATLQRRARFRLALKEWLDHEQSNGYLLSGVRLAEAELLHDNDFLDQGEAKEFYRQSIRQRDEEQRRALAQAQKLAQEAEARAEAEERARKEADARVSDQRKANQQIRRRSQWIALAAFIALMLAGVAGWFGSVAQEREAEANHNAATAIAERERADGQAATAVAEQDRAEEQTRIAEARRLAVEANSQLTKGATEIALLLAIEALHHSDNPTTRNALQAAVAARPYQVAVLGGHTSMVFSAIFSPDGQRILTRSLSLSRMVRLWDATGQPLTILEGHTDSVTSAVFSPDGQRILTVPWDNTARLWNANGQFLAILTGHTGGLTSAVFSPDGQLILTASGDGTARLWDATGQPLTTLTGHTDSVMNAVFSPDGKRILTASADGTARLWPVELEDWLVAAQCRVGRTLTEVEIRDYNVPTPLFFDETAFANRQCPPVYSWEQ